MVLVPGETALQGSINGKTGTPANPFVVNSTFTMTVNACDPYWNIVTDTDTKVAATTTDLYDDESNLQPQFQLVNGTLARNITFKTGNMQGFNVVYATHRFL